MEDGERQGAGELGDVGDVGDVGDAGSNAIAGTIPRRPPAAADTTDPAAAAGLFDLVREALQRLAKVEADLAECRQETQAIMEVFGVSRVGATPVDDGAEHDDGQGAESAGGEAPAAAAQPQPETPAP